MTINRPEIARDLMGLGSIPFFVIATVRIAMAGNFLELFHITAALVLLGLLSIRVKEVHFHTARIVILVIFTSVFYGDYYYLAFACLVALMSFYGFITYLRVQKVGLTVALALVCSGLAYLISIPFGIPNI